MTVSYSAQISTANRAGAFVKLLFVWKGSLYKLVWFDLAIYLAFYFAISAIYRFGLSIEQMRVFERISRFCDSNSALIPLTFVLAFYVSHVISRWWSQWEAIPWPDGLAFKVNCYCHGEDDQMRIVRRNITRYSVLSIVETLRLVSSKVKKRFPTYEHMVDAGLMTQTEMLAFRQAQAKSEYLNYAHWIPLTWASSLTTQAYEQGYIEKAKFAMDINEELEKLRGQCGTVLSYDWISLPLVYTQVVTLAVYAFFGVMLLGRQWLAPDDDKDPAKGEDTADYVFPFFTTLQFLFYVGWLKVAEALLNPFGEDDEDFDTNWMVDRHLQLSYMMADEVGQLLPHPEKDPFWDVGIPSELPYTVASLPFRGIASPTGAERVTVPIEEQKPIFVSNLDVREQKGKTGSFRSLNTLVTSVVNWASASMDGLKSRTPSTASEPNPSELNSTELRLKVKSARRNASLCSNPRPTSSLSPYLQRRNKKTSLASSTGSSVGSSANGGEGGKTSRKVSRQASDGSLVLAPVAEESDGEFLQKSKHDDREQGEVTIYIPQDWNKIGGS